MNPPVLLIIFNRPDPTRQVFEALRLAKPAMLFISADGARRSRAGEEELCRLTREITEQVDWECQVFRRYSDRNLGCDPHVVSAIGWMFEHVDKGIILEDDCVPDRSFFPFCGALLEKYSGDERIMHINGSNFQFGKKRGDGSYYFSRYAHSWGWATWKRAWISYDQDLAFSQEMLSDKKIEKLFPTRKQSEYWETFIRKQYADKAYAAWDTRWLYAIWSRKGYCITPNDNLITNIGSGEDATHTILKDRTIGQPAKPIGKISHPSGSIGYDDEADSATFRTYYYKNFFQKALYKIALPVFGLFSRK